MKTETKVLIVHETVLQSWVRDASTYALIVALIGLGWFIDSGAMQWVGAIIAFITMMVRGSGKYPSVSVSEARARLDAIERGEA